MTLQDEFNLDNDPAEMAIEKIEALKRDFVHGKVNHKQGAFIVTLPNIDDFIKIVNSLPKESLLVGDIRKFTGYEKFHKMKNADGSIFDPSTFNLSGKLDSVDFYIREGETNTWFNFYSRSIISAAINAIENYCDENGINYDEYGSEDGEEYESPIADERIPKRAFQIAKLKAFVSLSNQQQRIEFVNEIAKNEKWDKEEKDWYFVRDVASSAKGYYDSGILPLRAKALADSGKSVQDIATELGHTKNKISKAIATEIPDNIQELIDEYGIDGD